MSPIFLAGILAQDIPDVSGITGLSALVGGVTIPFGVGWFWNRQYLAAKEKHNVYLSERVEALTGDLVSVYEDQSKARIALLDVQAVADALQLENIKLKKELAIRTMKDEV